MEKQTSQDGGTQLNRWQDVDWQQVAANVTRLREQIYVASTRNDYKKVGNLQKLMLKSRSNWLLAIRRVTQINAGRKTPGVDREVVTTGKGRLEILNWLETINIKEFTPPPVRRVYIPKSNKKLRPLGIPTVQDRVIQAIVKNALEPYWEARFEHNSFGFRPDRSAHDAIATIHTALIGGKRKWILDADIKGAFDNIDHNYLMKTIGNFPARELIRRWLKTGIMENAEFSPTEAGTPQGGIISPLLANIALHGMEAAIGMEPKYRPAQDCYTDTRCPVKIVRYADDFVVLGWSESDVILAKKKLVDWLRQRGLEMSKEKTQIVHINDGFDFLGFNIRRYEQPHRKKNGYTIHTKPSRESIAAVTQELRECFQKGKRKPQTAILKANAIIIGWSNYFRIGVSKETFGKIDHILWHRTWKYAISRHPNKGKRWIKDKYFKKIGNRNWVFQDPESGIQLRNMGRTPIVRHIRVKYYASPDDPKLRTYWANRRTRSPHIRWEKAELWKRQKGICPRCKEALDTGEELEIHHLYGRDREALKDKQLLHQMCHDQITQGVA